MAYKHSTIVELHMADGSLRRYLQGDVPEGDYLSARSVHSYGAGPETVAKYGLAPGRGQIVEPSLSVTAHIQDSSPPSAAPQEEETMSAAQAIHDLFRIARTPGHPKRDNARRAILALPDDAGKASARVAGVAYESEHGEELDRLMGLSDAGKGVRLEGNQLILSTTGRSQGSTTEGVIAGGRPRGLR